MADSDELQDSPEQKLAHESVSWWIQELEAADKREEDWRKAGVKLLDVYSGKEGCKVPFNILYSNTEVLLPALYSAVPRPVVQRRYKDEDVVAKSAAEAGKRMLDYLLDTNLDGYETFDEGMRAAVLDALLPGRGVTSIKVDATVQEVDGIEAVVNPMVCVEYRPWDRFRHGWARKWSEVPWIAYEEFLDKETCVKMFGEEICAELEFQDDQENVNDGTHRVTDEETGQRKTIQVFQIWDKSGGRVVRYLCPEYKDDFLKVVEDPLGLSGFFNCPKPIQFVEKAGDLMPTAMYALYQNQAAELNELTTRITAIVDAIRAKAVYDGELGGDLETLLKAEETTLVPTDKISALSAERGLDKAIWFWPVDKLIQVLRELYSARAQVKNTIYEITGISDIIRGSSVASETATAQELKSQWGTLRLKRLQKEVQRFARDLLRMMLDASSRAMPEEIWKSATGLPFASQEDAMLAQAQAQMTGQPVPEMVTWEQVLGLLQNDLERAYRVDIETNSTVEAEATEDQKHIAEVMNALAQYLNGVAPLVQAGSMPFEAAQAMLMAIIRRFRFGPEIEEYVKAMKAPQQNNADQMKAQLEEEKKKADEGIAMEQERAQIKTERVAMQKSIELVKREANIELREQILAMKAELEQAKDDLRDKEFKLKAQAEQESLRVAEHETNLRLSGTAEKVKGMVKEYGNRTNFGKDPSGGVMQVAQQMQQMLDGLSAAVNELVEDRRSPKTVERDESGKIVAFGGRRVARDENGRLAGVE